MRYPMRNFVITNSKLDHVERVQRQPRQLCQSLRKRGLAATGITEHSHPFHAAAPTTRPVRGAEAVTKSLRLDIGRSDDFAPLLGLISNQSSEIGRRASQDHASEFGDLGVELGIHESGIDLLVEPVDNLDRRIPGRTDAKKPTRFIA